MKHIAILSTGGTFEKVYGAGAGVLNFSFPVESAVEGMIEKFALRNVTITYDVKHAKDSLQMDDADRARIAAWVQETPADGYVIIHGTDTMVATAHVVREIAPEKVVVFTGALQPAFARDTDAEFNVGGAVIAAQALTQGTYIVMNGTLFEADAFRKNPETGNFEHVSG